MYCLLVHGRGGHWDGKPTEIELNRFNTISSEEVEDQFRKLSPAVIQKISSIPCIFAYEDSQKMNAQLGWIDEIKVRGPKILFKYSFERGVEQIPFNFFDEYSWDFDIREWEMNRTHWAFKDVDIVDILIEKGILSQGYSPSRKKRVPFFSKPILAIVKPAIAELYSHAKIDELFETYGFEQNSALNIANKVSRVASFLDHVDWEDEAKEKMMMQLLTQVYSQNNHLIGLGEGGHTSNPIFHMTLLAKTLEQNGLKWNGSIYELENAKELPDSALKTLSLKNLENIQTAFAEYKAIKVLGEGGSGRVYQVQTPNGDNYAMKILAPEKISSEKISRFKNEIYFSLKTSHTNIIQVLDYGFLFVGERKCPFYIMPIYSENFRHILNTEMDINKKLACFLTFLDGLIFSHSQGCWHRDIKPENILYDKNNDQLILTDFGIAHINEEFLIENIETKEQSRLANFQYASPEQRIEGGRVDHKSDIYSVGLILNEIFTRTIPWGANHKRISEVEGKFSELDGIVEQMIQHEAAKRINDLQIVYDAIKSKI